MKPLGFFAVLLTGSVLAAGCTDPNQGRYPTDSSLMDRFSQYREAFREVAAHPDSQELQTVLGITQARVLPDSSLHFLVWYHDLPGPGGCAKGFAYLREPPRTEVDSIGVRWGRCPPEEAELFRRLEGNWYLFLTASN